VPTPEDVFDKPKREKRKKGQLKPEEYFKLFLARLDRIPITRDLISSHLRLVSRIAAKMRKKPIYGLEPWWDGLNGKDKKNAAQGYRIVWEELTSAGFVGLLESLERFDPSRGAFSTCADDNIKKAIRAEIRFLNEPVKNAGWSTSLTLDADNAGHYGDDEELDEGSEKLVVDDSHNDDLLQKIELECRLAACTTLTPIERRIVEARIDENYPTLRQLGAELDVCHQRVHQLESSAFEKIAATELPVSDLVQFYICPTGKPFLLQPHVCSTRPVDDWLDAITTHFYAKHPWLSHRLWRDVGGMACLSYMPIRTAMLRLADFGRKDHEPQPLRECEPEIKERFRESDKLLTRCLIVSPDGVAQHNRWIAPPHHNEEAKEKKELWRAPTKNPLWKPPPARYAVPLSEGHIKFYNYSVTRISIPQPKETTNAQHQTQRAA